MKLGEIYKFIVKEGMKKDPRGMEGAKATLKEATSAYRKSRGYQKSAFDKEKFSNPYSDTRILYGALNTEVRKVLVGIDIETPEILMADRLNREGEGIDLIMAHHPEGVALAGLSDVMELQKDILVKMGLDAGIAKDLLDERIKEVGRGIQTGNHYRAVDAARLLDIPFMCAHTASDNQVASFLQSMLNKEKPVTAGSVIKLLNRIPEYKEANKRKAGPMLIAGKEKDKAGKILVDMTGGTGGPSNIFARLSQAGIGTVIGMHMSEKSFAKAKVEHINVIIAGHIASDNLGMNLLLDRLQKKAKLKILTCSGFTRVRR